MKKFNISDLIITKINDVYSHTLPEDTEESSITKSCVLIIKKKGSSVYTVNGKKFTADQDTVVFIPQNTPYSIFVDHAGESIIAEFDIITPDPACDVCELFVGADKDVLSTAKNVLHYWKLKGPAYHSKCLAEFYTLITQISTAHSFTYSLAGKYRLIHRSVKFIEANYKKEDLYTPQLAQMSGIGETYYRSIFLSVFNVAPAKYIQNYRVEKAKELLVNSSGSIEDIAIAVGFANASYFCKVFKSTTGLTPTEFTAKAKKLG